MSTNSSTVFDVHWNNFWDHIAPHDGPVPLPSTFQNVSLSELKCFTGHLIETVIAKLKAQYAHPQSSSQTQTGGGTTSGSTAGSTSSRVSEADIQALCRDVLRELMTRDSSTATMTTTNKTTTSCDNEPTIVEPSVTTYDVSSVGDADATTEHDDDADDELLVNDASLRQFAGRVVEGIYSAMRQKLRDSDNQKERDDNYNCSNVVDDADEEIRSHVSYTLYTPSCWQSYYSQSSTLCVCVCVCVCAIDTLISLYAVTQHHSLRLLIHIT